MRLLREMIELLERETPDQYKYRVGRCPKGFLSNDQGKCVTDPSTPQAAPRRSPAEPKAAAGAAAPEKPEKKAAPSRLQQLVAKGKKLVKKQAKAGASLVHKGKAFISGLPGEAKKFFQDKKYRKKALAKAIEGIKAIPHEVAERAVEAAKDEVHEFKEAGLGIKSLVTGKKMTKGEKSALFKVARHMALTIGAAAATATGIGILAHAAQGFGTHFAAKVAGKVVSKLQVGEELHAIADAFFEVAEEKDDEPLTAAFEELGKLLALEVAKELENLADNDEEAEALAGSLGESDAESD